MWTGLSSTIIKCLILLCSHHSPAPTRGGLLYSQYCLFCFILCQSPFLCIWEYILHTVCCPCRVLLSGNFCFVDFSYMQLYPSLFAPLVITFLISLSRKFNISYMLINTFLIYGHRHLLWLHLSLLLPLLIGVSCLL